MPDPKDIPFDPYHKWLGIPKQFRPPTYYQLLGLTNGESDPEVIEEAAIRQSTHLRSYQMGVHAEICTKLLNQIGRAKQILLNAEKRAEYDRRLTALAPAASPPLTAPPLAAPPAATLPPTMPAPVATPYLVPLAPPPQTVDSNPFDVASDNHEESDTTRSASRRIASAREAKSKGPMIALAGSGVALVAAIIAVVVMLSGGKPEPKGQGDVVATVKKPKSVEPPRPPVEPPVKIAEKVPEKSPEKLPVKPPVEVPLVKPPEKTLPEKTLPEKTLPEKAPPEKTVPKVGNPTSGPAIPAGAGLAVVKQVRNVPSFDVFETLRDGRIAHGDSRSIRVHDLATNKAIEIKWGTTDGKVFFASTDDDDTYIILAAEKKSLVRLRPKTSETVQRYGPVPPNPIALAMGAKGTRFWIASLTGMLTAFDTNASKPSDSFSVPTEGSMLIATPADGAFVACVSAQKLYLAWSGSKLAEIALPPSLVRSIAVSPDGQIILLGTREGLYAATLPADVSPKTSTLSWALLAPRGSFTSLAMAPNGRLAFAAADTQVLSWELPSLKSLGGHSTDSLVKTMAVTHDSQLLMIGDLNNALSILSTPGSTPAVAVAKINPVKPPPKNEPKVEPKVEKSPPIPVGRMEIPAAEKLTEATKLVREQFAKDYLVAKKSNVERAALAEKFLKLARETNDDPVARYFLLTESRDLACQAAKWPQATEAISVLLQEYALEEDEQRLSALRAFFKVAVPKDAAEDACEAAYDFANDAISAERFEPARQYVALGVSGSVKAQNALLQSQFAKLDKELKATELEFERMQKAKALLATGNDETAQLDVGRYLVIRKGDWEHGLEYLAKTGSDSFGEAARKDMANPKDAKEQQEVGNLWWKVAEKEKGSARLAFLGRAGHWYRLAAPTLTGLNLTVVNDRLKTIDDANQPAATTTEAAKTELRRYRGHAGAVLSLSVASDGRRFYSGGADGTIRSWDIGTGRQLSSFNAGMTVSNFAFSPDERYLAVHDQLRVRVYTTDRVPKVIGNYECVTPPIWLADSSLLFGVTLSGQSFQFTPGTRSRSISSMPQNPTRLDSIPATAQLFTLAKQVYLLDRADNFPRPLRLAVPDAPLAVGMSPQGAIVIGGADKSLLKFPANAEKQTGTFVGLGDLPRCIVVSESGKRIAAGGLDKAATVWDADTEKVVVRFTQHTGAIQALAFLQGERHMLSASADGTIRLWNVPGDSKTSK